MDVVGKAVDAPNAGETSVLLNHWHPTEVVKTMASAPSPNLGG